MRLTLREKDRQLVKWLYIENGEDIESSRRRKRVREENFIKCLFLRVCVCVCESERERESEIMSDY